MTQQIDEHDFRVGFYVLGVFDILGQKRRLLQPMEFPPATDDERRRIRRDLEETVVAVDRLRHLFQRQLDSRRKAFDEDAGHVPEAERARFRAALATRIVSWWFSDTYCVAIPLEAGTGPTGAMATMADLRRSLEVAAATWLFSLSENAPIRGGIELGTAATMRENDVYGNALVEAHRLESEVAGWPRIVVGDLLVAALQDARQEQHPNYLGAATFATHCWSMLRQDSDGKTVLDVLGGSWTNVERRRVLSDVFARAHENVRRQLHEHREAGSRKLVSRYDALLAYFADHAHLWQS